MKESKDADGNTVVEFSDGSTATISKGDRGEQGAKGEKGDPGKDGAAGAQGEKVNLFQLQELIHNQTAILK